MYIRHVHPTVSFAENAKIVSFGLNGMNDSVNDTIGNCKHVTPGQHTL